MVKWYTYTVSTSIHVGNTGVLSNVLEFTYFVWINLANLIKIKGIENARMWHDAWVSIKYFFFFYLFKTGQKTDGFTKPHFFFFENGNGLSFTYCCQKTNKVD